MTKKTEEPRTEAWLVEWTETETGWGQRRDGAWYYPTEEAATKDTDRERLDMRAREKEIGRIASGYLVMEYSFLIAPSSGSGEP